MTTSKGGRPEKHIDYKQLDKFCAIHCTGEECAALLDMDYDTLNRKLKEEGHGGFTDYFTQKSANGKASLRRRQFQAANEGNPTMLIWLGKQWLGQSDKQEIAVEKTEVVTKIQIERIAAKNED